MAVEQPKIIKPCPFCENQGTVYETNFGYEVRCLKVACRVNGPCRETIVEAIAAWNARAEPELSELDKALKTLGDLCQATAMMRTAHSQAEWAGASNEKLASLWIAYQEAAGLQQKFYEQYQVMVRRNVMDRAKKPS